MAFYVQQWVNNLPEGATLIFLSTLGLLMVGWVSAIVLTARTKWLALLTFFPLTHPLAMVAMVLKQGSASLIPIGSYILAAVIWFSGSQRLYNQETKQLEDYQLQLKQAGEPLELENFQQVSDDPDQNVWDHPYLKLLATASKTGSEGEQARKEMGQRYVPLELPRTRLRIQVDKGPDPEKSGLYNPNESMLSNAIHLLQPKDEFEPVEGVEYPTDRQNVLDALKPLIEGMEEDLDQLSQALGREENIYPHQWEAGFGMLLPQLSKLKQFSQATSLATLYHVWNRDPKAALQTAKLGLRTAEVRDSALLISCLVQIAQVSITLGSIDEARQHHIWQDEDWLQVRKHLDSYSMIELMDESLRTERAIGHATMRPMLDRPPMEAMRYLRQLGQQDVWGVSLAEASWMERAANLIAGRFAQAFLARQWRLCLMGYETMIKDLEKAANASQNDPWKEVLVSWDHLSFKTDYGVLGGMLLPALDKAQAKAVRSQLEIELAKIAVDLERHFLEHGVYPESLENLVPQWAQKTPLDPMTRQPLHYRSLSEGKGFELYSVGLNGEDDQGRRATKSPRDGSRQADDLLIRVLPEMAPLPKYTLGTSKS